MKGFDTRFFLNKKGSLAKFLFGTVRQKQIGTEVTDIPFLCIKVFDTRIVLKPWRVSHEIFRHCATKQLDGKTRYPPFPFRNFLSIPENFSNTEGKSYEDFQYCETKTFRQNNDASPLLCMKASMPEFFEKQRSVPLRNFLALWDKRFSTDNGDIPCLCTQIVSKLECFWHSKWFPHKFFRHTETIK